MRGFVHSIETMGLVDGPGTRTVFFLQGCPLRCAYCHNPDTQKRMGGEELTPEQVLHIVERYRPYYGEEGGVTFSGGEPLLQGEFLAASLQILKREGYNTCVDTSGYGDPRYYPAILPHVDTLLFDVKAFDSAAFAQLTTVNGFDTYLAFLNSLEENGFQGQIWVRHVMVPGLTDSEEFMRQLVELIRPIWARVDRIEILPYHTAGVKKYERLGIPYRLEGVEPMDKGRAKELEIYANKVFAESLRAQRQAQAEQKQEQPRREAAASELEKSALLSVLRGLPLFADLAEEDVEDILKLVTLADIKEGEYVFKTGDPPEFMYLIYQGQMKIFINTLDGEEQIFYIYRDGDFVGGLNLLVETPYRYIGQALTDCKVVVISKAAFDKYFYDSPVVLRSVLVKSFERIRWAEELIQRLATSNASMKTAGLLLKLAKRIGVETAEGIRLELSMSREELGNFSGLRRETITRKLGEFKELGYIDLLGSKVIVIKDLEALESYVL